MNLLAPTVLLVMAALPAAAQTLTVQSDRNSFGSTDVQIAAARRFGEARGVNVRYVALPPLGYGDAVRAAAAGGGLPDVLMIDGPTVAALAYEGLLRPLDGLVDDALLSDMTTAMTAQGTYGADGKLYCLGPFDAGLGLLGNRRYLDEAGVRIATFEEPWTRDEFEDGLAALAALDHVDAPLDLKLNYGVGEWLTYAFSPILQSMGADLIDRDTWRSGGTLDSDEAVAALAMVQDWQSRGWIVPAAFGDGAFHMQQTAALSWIANWGVSPSEARLGEDLVILPMPDFGGGAVTASGSWCWTITRDAEDPALAADLVEALLSLDAVVATYEAGFYPPGRASALERTPRYGEDGDLVLYQRQLDERSVERPVHPAYPVISVSFAQAFDAALHGEDPRVALEEAARRIDAYIDENDGFPPFGG